MAKQMKTLTINGNLYEVNDDYARNNCSGTGISGNTNNDEYSLKLITLADVTTGELWMLSDVGANQLGEVFVEDNYYSLSNNHCTLKYEVKNGDMLLFTNAYRLSSDYPYIIVTNNEGVILEIETFSNIQYNWEGIVEVGDCDRIGGVYKIKNDGILYMSFIYTDIAVGEFFYIKHPHQNEPLVLYSHQDYVTLDTTTGDIAMKAIMEGRQILVRVFNADGGNTTAIMCPVLMYQLPNNLNDYLYLFYLEDSKQDLSAALGLAAGTVVMPTYGQLKLILSHTYNQSPLV